MNIHRHQHNVVHSAFQRLNRPPSSTGRPKTTTASSSSLNVSQISSNSLTSSSGNECVNVVIRCRPLSSTEQSQGHSSCVNVDSKNGIIELLNPLNPEEPAKCFPFDSAFDQNSKQLDVYDEAVRPIVDSVLQGFNGTVFAYGQTGTGKTFTMEGPSGYKKNIASEQRGVIPNSINHIFQHIAQSPPSLQYLVRASFLEIYQEEIRDLLDKSGGTGKRLELKERPDVGVYVRDLSSFVTQSVEEIEHVLKVGHSNRSVGRTNMNEHSSRSHAILVLTVESSEVGPDGQPHIRVGRLNLVDLAGSERQSKTGSEGQRFREATKINLSLSALGNVIAALTDQQSSHIPYRDSKLTRLLQDSLGGNSKTVMIANIGPASYNYEETLSTLRYSSRAKQIQNKPIINEDPKDALLREFQEEIERLKNLLEQKGTKRRQSSRNNNTKLQNEESQMNTSTDLAECEAEGIYREKQAKLEMERQKLIQNNQIIEEEKKQILLALSEREQELENERQEQLSLTAKIRQMQSKLLSGDGNLLDRTRKQESLLGQKRAELAEQRRREREVLQKLEVKELETAEIKQIFANLQQEVEAKRRKFQKLNNRLQQMRFELRDNEISNSSERQNFEQTVLEMNKELALKWLIIDNFIPPNVVENIKEKAQFDENEHQWIINEGPSNHQNFLLERRRSILVENDGGGLERLNFNSNQQNNNINSHLKTTVMADSGLGSSNGCSSTQGPSDASSQEEGGLNSSENVNFDSTEQSASQHENVYISSARLIKRPIAYSGSTRPISNWEMIQLNKLKNQLSRTKQHLRYPSNIKMSQLSKNEELPDFLIFDEVLRSCSKNLITFKSLSPYGSQINSNFEEQQKPLKISKKFITNSKIQRMIVDTSRIPIPTQRSVSRDSLNLLSSSRPNSASNSSRRRGSLAISRASLINSSSSSVVFSQKVPSSNAQNNFIQNFKSFTPENNNQNILTNHSNQSKNLRARSVFNNNNLILQQNNKNKQINIGNNKRMVESASSIYSSLEGKNGKGEIINVQRTPSSPAISGRIPIPIPLQQNYPKARGLVGGEINSTNDDMFDNQNKSINTNIHQKIKQTSNTSRIPRSINLEIYSKNKTKNIKLKKEENKLIKKANNEHQIVPFINSPCNTGSRETLSSFGVEEEDSQEENEYNNFNNNNSKNFDNSTKNLASSSWHTIGLAHNLLAKVQNKNKKCAKFKTLPLLQRPIFNNSKNKEENNFCKSFCGISENYSFNSSLSPFSKSFCCGSSDIIRLNDSFHSLKSVKSLNYLWTKNEGLFDISIDQLLTNFKFFHNKTLHKIRPIISFKRCQHRLLFSCDLLNSFNKKEIKEKQKNVKIKSPFEYNKAINCAIVFAAFSLFFRIIGFLFNILMLIWQNNL